MASRLLSAGVSAAIVMLCACSGSESPEPRAALQSLVLGAHATRGDNLLYVDDIGNGTVEIFTTRTWAKVGTITNGVSADFRNTVDASGNLYVTSAGNTDIAEFAPGSTGEPFTYDSGMEEPFDVATDSHANVYEADQLLEVVNEYPQGKNTVTAKCALNSGLLAESVAVDRSGDVFLGYQEQAPYGKGYIVEYAGGLSGCRGTVLGVSFTSIGGMAFDKHGDLVVCDEAGSVDVLKRPYPKIARTLGVGYSQPFSVRINRKNDRAFIADTGHHAVFVVNYPSGKLLMTLGSNEGISDPTGAVDSANYIP